MALTLEVKAKRLWDWILYKNLSTLLIGSASRVVHSVCIRTSNRLRLSFTARGANCATTVHDQGQACEERCVGSSRLPRIVAMRGKVVYTLQHPRLGAVGARSPSTLQSSNKVSVQSDSNVRAIQDMCNGKERLHPGSVIPKYQRTKFACDLGSTTSQRISNQQECQDFSSLCDCLNATKEGSSRTHGRQHCDMLDNAA